MSVFDQRLSGAISGGSGPEREEPVRREKRKKEPRPEKKKEKQVRREPEKKREEEKFVPDTSRWTRADEEEVEFEEKLLREQELNAIEAKKSAGKRVVIDAVLIAMCVYLVSLIYGVFNTDFKYGDTGEIEPVVLSVSDLSERAQFSVILNLYYKCRNEYQEVLKLDWMLVQGTVDSKTIAPKYEVASGKFSALATQIEGAKIDVKYYQVGQLMDEWANTACAYCEYVARFLTAYNAEAEAEAVGAREATSRNFQTLSQNIVVLGQELSGVDMSEVYNWDPDAYVQKEMTGVG